MLLVLAIALAGQSVPAAGEDRQDVPPVVQTAPPPRIRPPSTHRRGVTSPVPLGSPGTWVTNEDYPPAALRRGETGLVAFELDVDASGVVTGCAITQSSGSAILDAATCDLLTRRAQFRAAHDRKGRAVPSFYSARFRWEIPDAETPALVPWSQVNRAVVTGGGAVSRCTTQSRGEAPNEFASFCSLVASGALPKALAALVPDATSDQPALMVVEVGVDVDGLAAIPRQYEAPGRRLRGLVTASFELSQEGKVVECKTGNRSGELPPNVDLCAVVEAQYERVPPDARARTATVWAAISTGALPPRAGPATAAMRQTRRSAALR